MKAERMEEIRTIIQKLRDAEAGEDMAPRLLPDSKYALLELLDELKEHDLIEYEAPEVTYGICDECGKDKPSAKYDPRCMACTVRLQRENGYID